MKRFRKVLILFLCAVVRLPATDWTVLVFVQAANDLSSITAKNFNDMVAIGSNKNLNILLQWYKPGNKGVVRYKIEKNRLAFDSMVTTGGDGTQAVDLTDAMRWAVSCYPAEQYMLVLWNHGLGVIDPQTWGNLDRTFFQRAILYNESTRNYMNYANLSEALQVISQQILKGKKIDILGMDACLMGMLEIAFQAKKYVHYLIASEELEPAAGWNYRSFFEKFANGSLSSLSGAQAIVTSYGESYSHERVWNTLSAINLERIDAIKEHIDSMVIALQKLKTIDKECCSYIVKHARGSCLIMSKQRYVDLYSFCDELAHHAQLYQKNKALKSQLVIQLNELTKLLEDGLKLISYAVVANTASWVSARAHGISIYFPPTNFVQQSYAKTEFAQQSLWMHVLQDMR